MATAPPPIPSAPKNHPWKVILGVGCGACILMVLVVAAMASAYFWTKETLPVADADKELVVTAEVLADAGYQFKPDARFATWAKARLFDGSYELSYEYEDANGEQPVYITSWVEAHPSDTEASVTWHTAQVALLGTWKVLGVGIEAVDRAELLPWGSAHRTGILRRDGVDVGGYLFFRVGARTHMTVMMGICIGEPEEASGLWKPRLERLSGHSF